MLRQLDEMERGESLIALPHVGAVLATMVKLQISSGLVSLNKHIRHATVRRPVVVQLIRMFRDSGHVDYQGLDMDAVRAQVIAAQKRPLRTGVPFLSEQRLDM